ncbi:hypothetical protein Tco_1022413 [Tanacetum coccineum]
MNRVRFTTRIMRKTKMATKRKLYIPIMKKKAEGYITKLSWNRSKRTLQNLNYYIPIKLKKESISVDLVEEREDDQGSRPCYYNEREFVAGDTNLDATSTNKDDENSRASFFQAGENDAEA